ncbi:RUN and FYVE domain-containing protein 4 isoform X2 [Erinaceus europaeus]|uniref:RUN and FYVE domain-containing protein 4 isoform X2 n=1 Tax=Erinaceus europaeus TaxID=9365 RepID=A0ABM3XM56_ERIEU|nr:RUN and FYVE domain-containing protein 4 isoform X2 [Erinaceus europaeus]
MEGEETAHQLTRDLKAAVSAIIQGHGAGPPVTDTSAELHGLCGCLERLLQFDLKEQRGFLRARRDYWDFLCAALWCQRGDTEPILFVRSQDKLRTSLGRGRAFIRFCLAHQQLAESLQLCLLDQALARDWYGPRSPLCCPELQQGLLDALYALNGVTFHLDLQRPDLDGAWPLFSESCSSDTSESQAQRPRKTKVFPKEIPAASGGLRGGHVGRSHPHEARSLQDAPREAQLTGPTHPPACLEKTSLGVPQGMWGVDNWESLQQSPKNGTPRMEVHLGNSTASIQGQREGVTGVWKAVTGTETEGREVSLSAEGQRTTEGPHGARTEEEGHMQTHPASSSGGTKENLPGSRQGGEALQDVVESLRCDLQKAQEWAQHQKWLLEGQLEVLREQLSRSQAELEQERREAERRMKLHEEELGAQRDLVNTMKKRVLELIQEKDALWQQLQHVTSMAPGCCVVCNKEFRRLSRRYPCRVCQGLLCHACSVDYKARGRRCPPCAQKGEAQLL